MADNTSRIQYILEASQAKAEAGKLEASFAGVGKAAQSAGVAGAAGMSQVEAATKGTAAATASLGSAARTTKDSIAFLDREILEARGQLAQMAQQLIATKEQFGSNSEQVSALRQNMVATSAATRGMVAEKALLVAESKAEEAAVIASTSAFSRKTTMINTGQGALRGYDAAITGVIRSMGGINLGFAVGISLLAAILPKILSVISAKEALIKVDKEQIDLDLRRNNIGERTTRIHADIVSAMRIVSSVQKDYTQLTRQLNHDLDALAKGSETRLVIDAKTGASYQQLYRNAGELRTGVAELNAKLGEQEQILQPALEVLIRHKEATGESTEQTLKWADGAHFAAEQIEFMRLRLNALIPDIDAFTKKLNDLAMPKFDAASSLPGINSLQAAVETTFQLARDQGITDWADQVKFATPALKALDDALKQYGGTTEGYNKLLAQQENGMKAAIALMKEQARIFEESFAKQKEIKDIGPALEMESLKASIALNKENFSQRAELIKAEFDLRRAEMAKNRQDTELNLALLKGIEIKALHALTNEHIEHYKRIDAERLKDLNRFFDLLDKQNAEVRKRFVQQRQIREDEEKKFFVNQAKIEFAARSDRAGRRETQAGLFAEQADEMRRVHLVFNDLNRDAISFQKHLKAIDAFSRDEGFLTGLKDSLGGVINTFDLAQVAGLSFANSLQVAFDRAINYGENFAEVFGKTLLAGILSAIGQQAIAEGTYHILAGIAKLFNPFTAALGAKEIAAGVALVAFGSALVAGASAITASIQQKDSGGAGAAGTSGAGAAAGPPRTPYQPPPVSFPTSPKDSSITVKLDGRATKDFLEGRTLETLRGSTRRTEVGRRLKKITKP